MKLPWLAALGLALLASAPAASHAIPDPEAYVRQNFKQIAEDALTGHPNLDYKILSFDRKDTGAIHVVAETTPVSQLDKNPLLFIVASLEVDENPYCVALYTKAEQGGWDLVGADEDFAAAEHLK